MLQTVKMTTKIAQNESAARKNRRKGLNERQANDPGRCVPLCSFSLAATTLMTARRGGVSRVERRGGMKRKGDKYSIQNRKWIKDLNDQVKEKEEEKEKP